MLYSAATGRVPFHADGCYPQLERRADPVSAHRRVPAAFSRLVAACLEPAPEDRPTMPQLAEALDALLG